MSKNTINKKYTHFCVSKSTGKIVDAWEYKKDLDKESINEYYKIDMKDNNRQIKNHRLLTKKYLVGQHIDPFDTDNWSNN